jgi:sigma-B regulation protein RsbU (phosphoserine phosphatase)
VSADSEKARLLRELAATRKALAAANARLVALDAQLKLAAEVQMSLLPRDYLADYPLQVVQKYIPHELIGGDFFDFLRLGKPTAGLFISDASGHGVHSALVAAMLKSYVAMAATPDRSPAQVMALLNQELTGILRDDQFVTAFYGVIDLSRMKLTYSGAGHPGQILWRADGRATILRSRQTFLSVERGAFEDNVVHLSPGDRLVLFSDGVIETRNASGKPLGTGGLLAILKAQRDAGALDLSNRILSRLIDFMGEPAFADDLTIVIIEVKHPT